jgi:hypothetical protein
MGAHTVRCTARCIPQLSEIIADVPQWPAVGYASVVLCVPKTLSALISRRNHLTSATMFGLFCFVLAVLASPFKSKSRLEAENAVLRRQLTVLRRKMQGRVRVTNSDHWFFIQLYRWFLDPEGSHDYPSQDACALASCWLSLLLALEIAPTGRAPAN